MPYNPLVRGFDPRLKIDIASCRSASQPIGKLLPSLTWIHSQYATPKRKPVFLLKEPCCCGFLLAAHLISGVLNRQRAPASRLEGSILRSTWGKGLVPTGMVISVRFLFTITCHIERESESTQLFLMQ